MKQQIKKIVDTDISIYTFIKVLGFLLILGLFFYMTQLVALLFLSYILYAAFNSVVGKIESIKIGKFSLNRTLSILLVAFLVFFLLGFLVWAVIGPSAQEVILLFEEFDDLVERIIVRYNLNSIMDQINFLEVQSRIGSEISKILNNIIENPESLLNFGRDVFGGFLTTVTIISITVYQISQPGKIKDFVVSLFPFKHKKNAQEAMVEVEDKLGKWLGGQVFLMFLIGLASYIGLSLIGIRFALPLAIIFGLLDIIPIIGPIIGFIPLAVVALATADPWQVVASLVFFVIIQQIEGNFLVPKIMQKSVGLDPVVVIVSLMIGSQLLGALGAIVSIPVAVVLVILYQNWLKITQGKDQGYNQNQYGDYKPKSEKSTINIPKITNSLSTKVEK